ncbi:hypothetical protein HNQ56_002989 [Anaerotaenia torta]
MYTNHQARAFGLCYDIIIRYRYPSPIPVMGEARQVIL